MIQASSLYVIDSWPVLELFRGREPAASRFEAFLIEANGLDLDLLMSRINHGEVLYNAISYFGAERTADLMTDMNQALRLISVDDDLVHEAAMLKSRFSVSYADCFAAALAIRHSAPVVTGDVDFLKLQSAGLLRVEWLGA